MCGDQHAWFEGSTMMGVFMASHVVSRQIDRAQECGADMQGAFVTQARVSIASRYTASPSPKSSRVATKMRWTVTGRTVTD